MPPEMKPSPRRSSTIESMGHDAQANELWVKFKSGGTYVYSGVDADGHKALVEAKSHGAHFHQNIKGKYAHRKLDET